MSIKINNDNYDGYKKVFEIICRHSWKRFEGKLPQEVHPINVLNSWEIKSKSLAKKGLQSGLNDCIATLNHFPKSIQSEINTELNVAGLPNINSLIEVIPKTIKKVLSNKTIKNIDQFYLIKELIDDTSHEISTEVKDKLIKYMSEFEVKASTR